MRGKNPTRGQRKILVKNNLNPKNWLVVKHPSNNELVVKSRDTGELMTLTLVG